MNIKRTIDKRRSKAVARQRFEQAAARWREVQTERDQFWAEHKGEDLPHDLLTRVRAAIQEYYAADEAAHGNTDRQLAAADYRLRRPENGNSTNG